MTRKRSLPIDRLPSEVREVLAHSEVVFDRETVERAIDRMSVRITLALHDQHPVLMCVLTGGLVLAGDLMQRLRFPLELDYLHVTRYAGGTQGGALEWRLLPRLPLLGRTVLLVDDIFDAGITLAAGVDRIRALGAADVRTAVLVQKSVTRTVTLQPDFVGLECPDRYVFGRGMDYRGHWRNLAEIRALIGNEAS